MSQSLNMWNAKTYFEINLFFFKGCVYVHDDKKIPLFWHM